jgi:hypothetical protein
MSCWLLTKCDETIDKKLKNVSVEYLCCMSCWLLTKCDETIDKQLKNVSVEYLCCTSCWLLTKCDETIDKRLKNVKVDYFCCVKNSFLQDTQQFKSQWQLYVLPALATSNSVFAHRAHLRI